MTLTERAAYLKGLADGLALDDAKPEAKLLKEVFRSVQWVQLDRGSITLEAAAAAMNVPASI